MNSEKKLMNKENTTAEAPRQPEPIAYFPKQALVVYATNIMQTDRSNPSRYYIEISDIMQDKGRSFIGAGKPVTKQTLQTLLEVVAKSDKQTFFSIEETVPANLLVLDQRPGKNIIAWWRPAQRQTLQIKNRPSLTCWVPPLVFMVRNQRLAVAALNKNQRPGIASRLFHAPFFNVYNDMRVCLGDVKPPKTSGEIRELIAAWEQAFWQSEFTDTVTGAYAKKDLQRWWRKKRRGKFNLKQLKQSQINLKSLCEKV